MAKHFTVRIKVAYDEATVPDDMSVHRKDNVQRCVECGELLNDSGLEAIVEDWDVEVQEVTA
jgi:hypothetical protein